MATFALVHGAFCGAWCWEQVRPRLEGRGHVVVAMDLPCDQPSAGCVRYAKTVIDSLAKHPEPVVLVGHSLRSDHSACRGRPPGGAHGVPGGIHPQAWTSLQGPVRDRGRDVPTVTRVALAH